MQNQFQTHVDARGDLWVAAGTVIDRGTGALFPVGGGDTAGAAKIVGQLAPSMSEVLPLPMTESIRCVGGSGSNIILSGLTAAAGIHRPGQPGRWSKGVFTVVVTGASAATLIDETDVVAILTAGGTAPVGSYASTPYGESTYNGSAAFTVTAVGEPGWPGGLVNLDVRISAGTAAGGSFVAVDRAHFEHAADADWTITLAADGSAAFAYDGTVIATRAVGPADDPCGGYISTEAGMLFNPDFPDLDEGVRATVNPFGVLELVFNWSGAPDLDIGVSFLGETVGFGYGDLEKPYLSWGGDNTSSGGPETVTVDLAQAWDDGAISTFANVLALADWYPPAGGSGPASLTVTYDGGPPVTHTLHPGSATPASRPALALRIMDDGSSVVVGQEWTARVRAVRRAPVAAVVYLEVTASGGTVTGVAGPFLAAAMPSPSGGMVPFPLATSDGSGGLKQHHSGPLVWS